MRDNMTGMSTKKYSYIYSEILSAMKLFSIASMITLALLFSCDLEKYSTPSHDDYIHQMITDTTSEMQFDKTCDILFYTLEGEISNYYTFHPMSADGRKLDYTLQLGADSLRIDNIVWQNSETRYFEWVVYYKYIDSVASGYLSYPYETGTRMEEPGSGWRSPELLFVYLNSVIDYIPTELK